MKSGIDRLFNEMKLQGFAIYITDKGFAAEPEEKEDEFVKLSEYEKLERALEKANERSEHYRLKLRGSENLISLLTRDNERLLAENEGLQVLLRSMVVKEADKEHSNL